MHSSVITSLGGFNAGGAPEGYTDPRSPRRFEVPQGTEKVVHYSSPTVSWNLLGKERDLSFGTGRQRIRRTEETDSNKAEVIILNLFICLSLALLSQDWNPVFVEDRGSWVFRERS